MNETATNPIIDHFRHRSMTQWHTRTNKNEKKTQSIFGEDYEHKNFINFCFYNFITNLYTNSLPQWLDGTFILNPTL